MKKIAVFLIASTLSPIAFAGTLGDFGQTQNLIGVYGQAVGTPSSVSASVPGASASASGGNTVGGVGVFANGINSNLWFMHLGFNYGAGAPINGGSWATTLGNGSVNGAGYVNGHSLQFNARLGKLFQVAPVWAVGPYLAYQYAGFRVGLNGVGSANYSNNAVGGGVELVTDTGGPFDISAHLGYLAGVSASASAGGYSAHNPPSSGVLQIGAKGVYAFTNHFSAFAGIAYDRYNATYSYAPSAFTLSATINEVRGLVGVAYRY